ncbi:hypothetical protein BU24DRAFT_461841 [Aaosphaeria arxii CBS 175.79]|uniref:Zinc finger PHD-type domain-containing protein n=1 Tax=Aaosphaeria arxii CBS 175.79 TaxID=1450172 RepID=A0A6A5XRP1_9PLEO|nr:uncharacterized protein BU24DRAFT_461841 [Aaosphaeria arxii CBS 175.79]KAF2015603.1 hypothetical protein BU24DRAFT_461841 [Aaosphaeria arxii CBS 175.79]
MSPRRSSRARITQPPSIVPAAPSTSSSSVSSARTDRATRSIQKQSSPHKSSTPHSLSSEEGDEPLNGTEVEPPLTRRRTRGQDNEEDGSMKNDYELDEEIAEEEEITRCVCGQQEYPGPPSDAGKSKDAQSSAIADSDVQNDDAGGLFIQCDICKVWQHGGCVGIMDEATSPEEYFCEECRKDLHKLMTSSKGQKYSRYLPVYDAHHGRNARRASLSKEPENKNTRDKDRISRASAESFSKRRSTMNSRAAYDEDEVLRKVLEESKNEGGKAPSDNSSSNRKKRSRDDSEEVKPELKRQRTSSRSPSGSPVLESDDDMSKPLIAKQKPRGAAARSQREKELRDKERERERAEAANRRKGRAERRKADDIEIPEVTPTEEPAPPTESESVPPETPTVETRPPPVQRKSGRPPQKRQSRLGRNQYTRDAPTPTTNGASPAPNQDTPNSPQISATNGVSNGHDSSDGATASKPIKSKGWRLEKLSWNEIRRPAGVMQNYIAQRQVEMAGEKRSPAPAVESPKATNGHSKEDDNKTNEDLDVFRKLDTLQMMDDLSRELVHWQHMVAEQNEK